MPFPGRHPYRQTSPGRNGGKGQKARDPHLMPEEPRIFTSMVSVGAPGMANSTTSLWFSSSAYATVLGATLIRFSSILATSLVVSKPTFPDGRPPGPRPRLLRLTLRPGRDGCKVFPQKTLGLPF